MTRVHADPVVVERGVVMVEGFSGRPTNTNTGAGVEGPLSFSWRGRSYTVVQVVDHWVEAGAWWRRAGRTSGRNPGHGPSHGPGTGHGSGLGIDDGEQEIWRVEASTGRRTSPLGVFDLRWEWGSGQWSLIRVHD